MISKMDSPEVEEGKFYIYIEMRPIATSESASIFATNTVNDSEVEPTSSQS